MQYYTIKEINEMIEKNSHNLYIERVEKQNNYVVAYISNGKRIKIKNF